MNIIDKFEMLDEWEEQIPPEGTEEYHYWAKAYKFMCDRRPFANAVVDTIQLRRNLLIAGFDFEEIKKIMTEIHKCSINTNSNRINMTLDVTDTKREFKEKE